MIGVLEFMFIPACFACSCDVWGIAVGEISRAGKAAQAISPVAAFDLDPAHSFVNSWEIVERSLPPASRRSADAGSPGVTEKASEALLSDVVPSCGLFDGLMYGWPCPQTLLIQFSGIGHFADSCHEGAEVLFACDHAEEADDAPVDIVASFDFAGRLCHKDRSPAAEGFNVLCMRGKSIQHSVFNSGISFSAEPGERSTDFVHFVFLICKIAKKNPGKFAQWPLKLYIINSMIGTTGLVA